MSHSLGQQQFNKTNASNSKGIDDEYVDDEFEVEEESGSMQASCNPQVVNNLATKGRNELVDFNVSASASMLPPVAGRNQSQDGFQSAQAKIHGRPMPQDFALNLAESEQSLNFDISESKAGAMTMSNKQKIALNQSSSKNLHDGSESMD